MIKKSILALCSVIAFGAYSNAAYANTTENPRYYIGTQYNIPTKIYTDLIDSKSGTKQSFPNIDFAIGAKVHDNFRIEFAPGYRSYKHHIHSDDGYNDITERISRLDLCKLMFNGYIDGPKFANIFTPYFMAGAGYARIKHRTFRSFQALSGLPHTTSPLSTSLSGNNFSWQTGLGVNTSLSKSISMDVGAVYADYGRMKFADPSVINNKSNSKIRDIEVFIGFKYHF